jgi:hypothetical protein
VRLFDRFRYSIAGLRRRSSATLVHIGRPEPLRQSQPQRALPAPEQPRRRRSTGIASLYGGRTLDPSPCSTRPQPLGRGPAHDKAIICDQASPWRDGGPDVSASRWDKEAFYAELFGWD